ncbi:MAG: MBL fold metallo-hydrolase [Chloroflexi bacterium]|nr:MBL fold metallo-hydrolase [Chloroflexota bacterium]MCL5104150.1 MBL fold metallo-hydrolase [Armatimonadota bacterium]
MALEVHSLASGSSGNSILVRDGNTAVLIDAGVGIMRLVPALLQAKQNPADLSAILITHEHSDHTVGAFRMARKYGVPLVANAPTLERVDGARAVPSRVLDAGEEMAIGDMLIRPFPVSHDAARPVGYSIHTCSATVCSATDTGVITPEIRAEAARADLLILESNHDEEMLRTGPYPYFLKKRIVGERGHLSNDVAAGLIVELAETERRVSIWLAHLSKINNTPAIALAATEHFLWTCLDTPMDIQVARRDVPSLWWQRD